MNTISNNIGTLWRWLSVTALSIAFSSSVHSAEMLTLTAGSPGGGYFKAAAAFAEYIKSDISGMQTTVIPGGGWTNAERLDPASKLADIGVIENAAASMAYAGTGPGGKKYDFRMLAAFRGPSVAQAVIPADVGVASFEELKEKKYPIRIATFPSDQLAYNQAIALLDAYGISVNDIKSWGGKVVSTGHREGIRLVMDGLADMWFTGGSMFPHHLYIRLGTKKDFKLLPISKEAAEKAGKKFGQGVTQVPENIYRDSNGTNPSYWSPATVIAFAVRTDLSNDLVYKLTKALADHKTDFHQIHKQHKFYDPKIAWQGVGEVPLHPGAEKYYKEMGYMN